MSMKVADMRLSDAVRVRSAEFWLRLGEPKEAMLELQKLPQTAARHPWSACF